MDQKATQGFEEIKVLRAKKVCLVSAHLTTLPNLSKETKGQKDMLELTVRKEVRENVDYQDFLDCWGQKDPKEILDRQDHLDL